MLGTVQNHPHPGLILGVAVMVGSLTWLVRQFRSTPRLSKGEVASHAICESSDGDRCFTVKTPADLLGFHKRGSSTQADELMKPFKSNWISVVGQILYRPTVVENRALVIVAVTQDGATCTCTFTDHWRDSIKRISAGDRIKVQGKISEKQDGFSLCLEECSLLYSRL